MRLNRVLNFNRIDFIFITMKLKIILLIIAIIVASNFSFSQNGYAYYNKQLLSSDDELTNDYLNRAVKQLNDIEYQLTFNKSNALFKKIEKLSMDKNPIVESFTEAISGFTGEVYFNNVKNEIIHNVKFSGSTFLIKKKAINWNLSKETLQIDKFLCYKATAELEIENSSGLHNLTIVAWYAPEISLPYGPDGYGGLPGLILQLENNGIMTTLKRVEFLSNEEIQINFPLKGNEIEEEAFNALTKESFDNRKKNRD